MSTLQADDLAEARHLGRLEAERLDSSLRQTEGRQREERLTRLAWGAEAAWEGGGGGQAPAEGSAASARLQWEVEQLRAFHHAVVHSRAWRLVQAIRRPFGRAW